MNILEELQKKSKENQERWEAIDGIISEIKDAINEEENILRTAKLTDLNTALLLLLAEQLRPMAEPADIDTKELFTSLLGLANSDKQEGK